jgi:hypothetical protein
LYRRAPDSARVKAKMMYASTKDFFKSHLDGLSLEFQASELDDISEQVGGSWSCAYFVYGVVGTAR